VIIISSYQKNCNNILLKKYLIAADLLPISFITCRPDSRLVCIVVTGETVVALAVYLLPVRACDLLHHLYSPEDDSIAVHEPISGAA